MPAGVLYDTYQVSGRATSWQYITFARFDSVIRSDFEATHERRNINPDGFRSSRIQRNPLFLLNQNTELTRIGVLTGFQIQNDGLDFTAQIGNYTYYDGETTDKIDNIIAGRRQYISIGFVATPENIRYGEVFSAIDEDGLPVRVIDVFYDIWALQEISSVLQPADINARIMSITKNI